MSSGRALRLARPLAMSARMRAISAGVLPMAAQSSSCWQIQPGPSTSAPSLTSTTSSFSWRVRVRPSPTTLLRMPTGKPAASTGSALPPRTTKVGQAPAL